MKKKKDDALVLLVEKAIGGDRGSFERLCEKEVAAITYSCTKMMGSLAEGEDAAQEVFIELQKSITKLKRPELYVAWVQGIVFNTCNNLRRKSMKNPSTIPVEELAGLFSDEDDNVLPAEYLQKKEKSRELLEIIDGLPEQVRACVLMHYFNEMRIADIALALQISEGSVKGYLYVGREKMRRALSSKGTASPLYSALPMSSLSALFKQELQEKITSASTRRVLKSAGIRIHHASLASVVVPTVFVLAATVFLCGYTLFASNRPAPLPAQSGFPQRHSVPGTVSSRSEDMVFHPEASAPVISSPGLPPSGPGEDAPDAAPAPAPPATLLRGQLLAEGLEEGKSYPYNQYYVALEKDGGQIAVAMADEEGTFIFEPLFIPEAGTYLLRVNTFANNGMVTSDLTATETEIELVPGETLTLSQPISITSHHAPVISASLLDKNGRKTVVNPHTISVTASAATEMEIYWTIQAEPGGKTVKEGSSAQLGPGDLTGLAPGLYCFTAHVEDSLGSHASVSVVFYV